MSEPRRRRTTERTEQPPAAALQNATKRRPSLASPLPPSASVPSTPLPGKSHLPVYQPQLVPSPDPPSGTRGLMKRLLAKPAPVNLQERESVGGHETVVVVAPPPRMESLGGQKPLDEFDKSMHALDLVGQIDISMTDVVQERRAESPPGKRQRKMLRRRPSATSKSNPSTPFPDSFDSLDQMPTPSTITTPLRFTRHSHSPSSSSPPLHSIPFYTVFGSGQVVSAGGPRDPFWDTHGASSWRTDDEEDSHHPVSPAGVGLTKSLTRKLSGKFKRNESDHQLRAKASVQSLGSSIMDREPGVNKKSSPDSPGESRFWKIVKKLSVGGLREKNLADADDRPPPVPPLPTNLINQLCDSSPALKKAASSSALPMPKSTTPHSKSPQSAPNGPRPSTTTLSSSHSSDVASSRFFNRTQSAHSSTSSLGDEMTPPLPKTPIFNDKMKTRKLQQHIIPPSELARNHSTSTNPTTMAIPVPIPIPPPSMDDDWTIVRSPSVEFEVLSLPPPPRRRGLKVGLSMNRKASVMEDRVGVIPASTMLKMVDADVKKQEEEEDEKPLAEDEKNNNNDKSIELDEENKRTGSDDQSHSPVIPSFSTTETINSFPARRASASISPTSRANGSPVALSPSRTTTASPTSPQRADTTNTFGRVRQQLFGMNDEREESEFSSSTRPNRRSHVQLAHLRRLSSTQFPDPRQSPPRPPHYKHHRHSSGNSPSAVVAATTGIVKSKSANGPPTPAGAAPPSASASTPHPHRRSMSLSPALPSLGLFTSRSPARSMRSLPTPPPLILHSPASSSRTVPASPPPPPVPSPTTKTLHRTRSSSHTRSGFSGRKLSQVLFSSSAASSSTTTSTSASSGSLAPSSPASFTRTRSSRPGSASGHQRTIATLISRSISISTKNPASSSSAAASQALMPPLPMPVPTTPRSVLTDQEKAEKWNDLLDRSARAGGTLHLDAGGRVLASDDVESVVGLE